MSENVANNVAQREMQDLTEQWKNGTLETGYYYFKTNNNVKNGFLYKGFKYPYDGKYNTIDDVVEVLAPVPTYEEWVKKGIWYTEKSHNELLKKVDELTTKCNQLEKEKAELLEKIKKLQKQLGIAVKALREYADKGNWCNCLSWNGFMEDNEVVCDGQFGENGFEPAQKALKEIDEVLKCQ